MINKGLEREELEGEEELERKGLKGLHIFWFNLTQESESFECHLQLHC